jgi:phenylacetate-CoA ligase
MHARLSRTLTGLQYEIIFIDDGSTDSTFAEISDLVLQFPDQVSFIKNEINLGMHRSWKSGALLARYPLVCLIDGDLQNPPEAILDLLTAYEYEGADFVIGCRTLLSGEPDGSILPSKVTKFMLNLIFGTRSSDLGSGFALASKHVLLDVLNAKRDYFFFQRFLNVSAVTKGYKVIEVETLFNQRNFGSSFILGFRRYIIPIKLLVDIPKALIEFRLHKKFQLANIPTNYKSKYGLIRRILFEFYFFSSPLHKWIISSKAKEKYLWLKTTEFLDQLSMKRLQLDRLRLLLLFANRHVPYYKSKFYEAGFDPRLLVDIENLEQIPLLSKANVRENIHFKMFSDNHKKRDMHRIKTSGSTGEPFVCYADKFQLEMRLASTLRAYEMAGWKFGDKQLRLWHQTIGMSKSQVLREKIDSIIMRRKFVPAFELTEEKIFALMKKIERLKPAIIDGYAESLNFISALAKDGSKWNPIAIISSAQELTDHTRMAIESTFNSRVYDKYGSREFSGIAYQCGFGENYHVQDESYIVEILIDGRRALPGEVGEIVITDLNNFSTPMIRYRIGDLAMAVTQNSCPCGRAHSQIGKIYGRTQALIYCSNGVWLPGAFFLHFFKEYDFAIKHFQVHQEDESGFFLKLVVEVNFNHQLGEEIVAKLQQFAGSDTKIVIELVESIPLLITGKRTPVVSKLKIDYQTIGLALIKKNQYPIESS